MGLGLSSKVPTNILGSDGHKTQAKLVQDTELCRVQPTGHLHLERNAKFCGDIRRAYLTPDQTSKLLSIEPECRHRALPVARGVPGLTGRRHPDPKKGYVDG